MRRHKTSEQRPSMESHQEDSGATKLRRGKRHLAQSVYPSAQYAKIKEAKAIEENFSKFCNSYTNYDELSLKLVNLIMCKKSKRQFPQDLFCGSRRSDAKVKDWIQCYFEGSTNPNLSHRICKRQGSQQERKACKEFDVLRMPFFRALEKTVIGIRKESTRKSVSTSQDPCMMSEPPQEKKFSSQPRSKFRGNRVHQVHEDYGEESEEAEEFDMDPYVEGQDTQKAEQEKQASEEEGELDASGERRSRSSSLYLSRE